LVPGGVKQDVVIKESVIDFGEVDLMTTAKMSFLIKNVGDRNVGASVMKLMEPFYCKHVTLNLATRHYIKVPIEFKPKQTGNFVDKVMVRVEGIDAPLTCILKGRCNK
jgi:hypothetical protein